jgi:WD40 repeat protein
MVIMQDECEMINRIDHIVQNHAKAIHNIEVLPNECNERGFAFVTGSSDKTIRKWYIDTQKDAMHGTQTRIGLLCDEFSHWMKNKINKPEDDISEELGQVRSFKIAKVETEEVIFCGDLSGYVWIFDAQTFTLKTISELHEDEIIDLVNFKTMDFYDPRNNLLVTCSRDNKVKSFKYVNGEVVEGDGFDTSYLPAIGLGFIQEDSQTVKLVYVDAKSNLCLRNIKENLNFDSPIVTNMEPKKFFSLAVCDNRIAIGTDSKIQF